MGNKANNWDEIFKRIEAFEDAILKRIKAFEAVENDELMVKVRAVLEKQIDMAGEIVNDIQKGKVDNCSNCFFSHYDEEPDEYFCVRYPPVMCSDCIERNLNVSKFHWCGEHMPVEED